LGGRAAGHGALARTALLRRKPRRGRAVGIPRSTPAKPRHDLCYHSSIPAFQHVSKRSGVVALRLGGRAAAARTGGELRTRRVVFVNHAGMLECWNGAEDLRIAGVIGGRARQKSSSPCGWRVTLRLGSQPAPRSALHFSLVLKVVLRVGALRIARVQNICES
jgi:hypothetical protein